MYEVRLSRAAARSCRALTDRTRAAVRSALERLASEVERPQHRMGKRVKTIKGVSVTFHRLRVGDHLAMFDVIHEDRVILVLGIVHRRDLECWLRSR
ncbi:MAG: type II toxin-antitoxin system RelE family toxin [Gemmatimonadota bacterium]